LNEDGFTWTKDRANYKKTRISLGGVGDKSYIESFNQSFEEV